MTEPMKMRKVVLTPISWSDVREQKSTLNFKNSVAVVVFPNDSVIPYEYYTLSYSPSLSIKTIDFSAVIPTTDSGVALSNNRYAVLLCKAHSESTEQKYVNVPLTVPEFRKLGDDDTIDLDWEVDRDSTTPMNVEVFGECGSSLCLLITSHEEDGGEEQGDYTRHLKYAVYLDYQGNLIGTIPYKGLKVFMRVLAPSCRKSPFLSSEKVCEIYRKGDMPIVVV